ncbi:hypothetical protein PoB_003658200 [Plakobranchus ocellatus]|uniref:Uncharacterized protein n=1 Tax=Plakobranchus ocellatus TaxID=259542 RepID=A0AAV4ASX8_9GAST|nr:hypothetical protein PoB_003658200 [Plakobranchus ocellatus]
MKAYEETMGMDASLEVTQGSVAMKFRPANCIWGDQAMVRFVWRNSKYEGDCAGLKREYKNLMCYDKGVARYCCGTCGKFYTGIEGMFRCEARVGGDRGGSSCCYTYQARF